MKDAVVIPDSKRALSAELRCPLEEIEVHLYTDFPDDRIGWAKTYVVTYRGQAVGFTDTEVK